MGKNNDIQILRTVGMVLILIGHMPIVLPNLLLHGYSFVTLFFVISGYLMAVVYNKKYNRGSTCKEVLYKEGINKFFRLAPLMCIWILIYFIIGTFINYLGGSYGDMARWGHELKASLMFNYNYYLASLDIGGLFGQYWSLFVEIHFYILSIVFFLIFKKKNQRIIISGIIIVLTIFVFRPLTPLKLIRYATHTQLDACFLGVIIGCVCDGKPYLRKYKIPLYIKSIISITLLSTLFFIPYYFDNFYNNPSIKYFVYLILSGILVFLARENDGWILGVLPSGIKRLLIRLGNSSASTYVSHIILYSGIYTFIYHNTNMIPEIIKSSTWGISLQVIILIMLACLVGELSRLFIEEPYSNFGKQLIKKFKM